MPVTRDYLVRLIEQVAQALARMLKLSDEGQHDAALRQAEGIYDLLGVPRDLIDFVDTKTLAELLREPDKMRAAARLLKAEGDIYKQRRDPLTAHRRHLRALELYLEARKQAGDPTQDREEIRELVRLVPQEYLAEQYRAPDDPPC